MSGARDGLGTALISGGSRGIGRATALRLARDGYDVSFAYRADEDAANRLGKELDALGVRWLAQRLDVADAPAVRDWVGRTESELGPVTVAVASAGITRDRPLLLMSDQDWQDVIDTNLDGTAHVCRAALFPMVKRRAGSIVTLSSVSGAGNPGQGNYSASKAGIIGLTCALAKEAARFGIRVNAVAPGMIETDMTAEAFTEEQRARTLAAVPLGRFGTAEEVAESIAFLVSDKAAYITGAVLRIDGGIVV
ncbi:3-oxoacyl-ACP reductase FabG [Streptomyces aurantiogriseus]|uniref:3-oxoacyl-[acyl-carrier-protein] reductase n=1 Tax=Streptomyces aurantiogriseus TaxID=66870 RepID=A0A918C3V7_9ACTN|nr:3-oxoacyl-ACP reductase FabG [Streptomyces aurantiogriseus]GGR05294.1 3-oxoacyl-[acyl-carrier-protein] reductase [Streptomyces aurantiogriseus]